MTGNSSLYGLLLKIKKSIYNNIPLLFALTILLLSLFYTFNQLSSSSSELTTDSQMALNDFNTELNQSITEQIGVISSLMMKEWLNIENNNVSELYSYSRFQNMVPTFYNYSPSYLAINWINSTGFIKWVYPYERNQGAINQSVVYYSANNGGELNMGFYIASTNHTIGLSKFGKFFQGGEGFVAYIPIIYNQIITGYFNVVFEIKYVLNTILHHQSTLDSYSYNIYENGVLVANLNRNFSIKDNYVIKSNVYIYNIVWIVYTRPSEVAIYETTPYSEIDIFIAEIILCIITYYLGNGLKKKNEIIRQEYAEKEKIMDTMYRGKKFEALGTLSGGIAHDFNNIMTNIKGHVEIVKSNINRLELSNDSETIKSLTYSLSAIEKNLNRSKDITGQILSFSRQGTKNFGAINMIEVVQEGIKLVKETTDKRINFIFSPYTDKCYVLADQTQLLRVFMNIFINAINAVTDPSNAKILITCNLDSDKYNHLLLDKAKNLTHNLEYTFYEQGLMIKIHDNGRGMNSEQLKNAFDPFYSHQTTGKGTGLGLSIVYANISEIGGEVNIQSALGDYTEIIIKLPHLKIINPLPNAVKTLDSNFSKKYIENRLVDKSILLIDDEDDIVFSYSTILKENGFNVKTFTKGLKAIEYFEENYSDVSVAILDMNLPDINGSDIIKAFRSIKEDQKVMIISGYFENKMDFSDIPILHKPFEKNQFLNLVLSLLQ